ncbi:hypothetical protein FPV14_10790 [Staphylococcus argenteus]|nr:hypothetical protein FPV14_10790 [Staphylococcus argenteus]
MRLQQAFFNSSQPCRRGPNTEKLDSQFLQTMQVGVGQRNKFCENIISVPLPYLATIFISSIYLVQY